MPAGSLGAARVREDFNPSKVDMVTMLKRYTADLIDICNSEMGKIGDGPGAGEEHRLWSLAMTYYEIAAMFAVKGATTPKNKP